MENDQNSNLEKIIDTPDLKDVIEQKKKENSIQAEVNKIVSDLKGDSEEENIVSDLFYKSVKSFFDLGFELADKLNLELLSSFKLDEKKKRE